MAICAASGVDLYYEACGQGMPLLFIHGHTLNAAMWDAQWPVFCGSRRAIRHDLRGHGRSSTPATGYSLQQHAADLCALLDHLHIERAALVGLSLGGGIALQAAITYPARVSALALVDSTLDGYAYSPAHRRMLHMLRAAVLAGGAQNAMRTAWLDGPMFAGMRRFPERFAAILTMTAAYAGADYVEQNRPHLAGPRQIERLSEISAPAIVVVGERDTVDFQGTSEALQRGIRGAALVRIEDAQHIPNMEQPQTFNRVLGDFLAGLDPK